MSAISDLKHKDKGGDDARDVFKRSFGIHCRETQGAINGHFFDEDDAYGKCYAEDTATGKGKDIKKGFANLDKDVIPSIHNENYGEKRLC